MTIDEKIQDFRQLEYDFEHCMCDTEDDKENLMKYQQEYEYYKQLAEWLEELKFLRQWKSDVVDEFCKYIDDFAKWLENKKYLMKEIQDHDFCYTHYDELKASCVTTEYFAEQLKTGIVND